VVGKVISLSHNDLRGLIAEVKIARTPRGDETLQLASEGMLSASAGFGVYRNGEKLDRFNNTRRIIHGWLDHVSMVMRPAYEGAEVLAVRSTPNRDVMQQDPVFVWARLRNDPVMVWARQRGGHGR
jgi:phage head maturation protease